MENGFKARIASQREKFENRKNGKVRKMPGREKFRPIYNSILTILFYLGGEIALTIRESYPFTRWRTENKFYAIILFAYEITWNSAFYFINNFYTFPGEISILRRRISNRRHAACPRIERPQEFEFKYLTYNKITIESWHSTNFVLPSLTIFLFRICYGNSLVLVD